MWLHAPFEECLIVDPVLYGYVFNDDGHVLLAVIDEPSFPELKPKYVHVESEKFFLARESARKVEQCFALNDLGICFGNFHIWFVELVYVFSGYI